MISSILSRLVILVFGTLYPAYASYKAVRTKNFKEYVKWMMYWIVFALFTCVETFTDVFLSWFPFYYEIKIILVIWLLSPATKGSSILYRKFVHPMLSSREQEIDEYISKAKEQSYKQVLDLGSKGVSVLMQTAIKGGGGIVNQLKKSYSLSDLTDPSHDDGQDETDIITDPRLMRRRRSPLTGATSSTSGSLYFSEVDVRADRIAHVQSAEDISSGYSSGEGLYATTGQLLKIQAREGLTRTGSLTRTRTTRVTRSTAVPRKSAGSDESDDNSTYDTNIIFMNDKARNINNLLGEEEDISSEMEFFDSMDNVHDEKQNNTNKEHNSNSNTLLTACEQESNENLVSTHSIASFSETSLLNVPSTMDDGNITITNKTTAERGGKYNKKIAPAPPITTNQCQNDTPTIKATLVLKPGVVKNVPTINEASKCKEVFATPKSRRKNFLLRSTSNVSRKKQLLLEPLTNFLKSPKINFWKDKLDDSTNSLENDKGSFNNEKRSSWHVLDRQPSLLPLTTSSKLQSKSEIELRKAENYSQSSGTSNPLRGSKMSIKDLKDSPLTKRRLKILRKYIDDDID